LGGSRWETVRGQQVCVGGDIIVAVDSIYVNSLDDLVAQLIAGYAPQDTVTLRVVRGDKTFDVPVLLESRPSDSTTPNCGN
jgi:S1-C subfamily serine protease